MGWTVLTNLGDSAIMVPAVLAVAAWLCAVRARKVAVLWLALCGMSVCVVAATKIAFMGWGLGIRSIDFTGISGHANPVHGGVAVAGFLIGGKISERLRLALTGMGFLLALGIAVSRVVLMFHSPSEVIAGCTVGGIVALAMAVFARRLTDPSQTMNTALAIGLAVLMIGQMASVPPRRECLVRWQCSLGA